MRTVFVRTACGCAAPGIAAALDREAFEKAARAQLGKGRRQPAVTTVAAYVNRKEGGLTRKLAKVLKKHGEVVIKRVLSLYVPPAEEVAKAEKKPPSARDIIAALESEWVFDTLDGYITPAMVMAYRRGEVAGITQVGIQALPDMTDQLDTAAREYAERRGGELITELADTTRDSVRGVITNAVEEGMSTEQLRSALEDSGAFGESRARMIARTELAFAHVQGNVEGWRATGEVEGKRAVLGDLHDVADICDDCVDAGTVGIDEEFASGAMFPPFHPNAVLAGSSFASYGELVQMVAAPYEGPAVRIVAEASALPNAKRVDLTIGPNHPVLTHRGFVAARFLKEGDEVLYDALADDSFAGRRETNLKQVMLVENAFEALRSVCDAARISAAAHYFHGDEAFIYGEVEAIRPERGLLPVLDSGGVEQLCKHALVRSNTEPTSLTGDGTSGLCLWGVGAAAPRLESMGRDFTPPLGACQGVARFQRLRIVAWHAGHFKGHAFDASTMSSIYNSGGLIVKNCVCDIEPVLKED